jgi:hypothetical protein
MTALLFMGKKLHSDVCPSVFFDDGSHDFLIFFCRVNTVFRLLLLFLAANERIKTRRNGALLRQNQSPLQSSTTTTPNTPAYYNKSKPKKR